ncbi:MAG TPA: helix-turn-helix domain-containing protein [Microthrixaceae bacterium]|nr:helix-turn-helix domain-containing protein [Microthrixaceae bacterium]
MAAGPGPDRLDLLKALGDNTRYAIYLELARSPRPLSTAEISETLDLHANTVRPHLERMREVGLLDVRPAVGAGVGRPHHLYSLAADAPSLGLEAPVFPMLARMLLQLAADAGLDGEAAAEAGREQGTVLAAGRRPRRPCVDAAESMLAELGFDPERVDYEGVSTLAFTHCPFAELAESNPELVCSLHRGLLEGFVSEVGGGTVTDFHDRSHREPCLADVTPHD